MSRFSFGPRSGERTRVKSSGGGGLFFFFVFVGAVSAETVIAFVSTGGTCSKGGAEWLAVEVGASADRLVWDCSCNWCSSSLILAIRLGVLQVE